VRIAGGEKIMANEITLRPTVDALDKVIGQLRAVQKKATGAEKKELSLKVQRLVLLREVIIFDCGRAYPVYPLTKR
jgi:hypothetical protein